MNTLAALKCVPCKGGEPLLSDAEITDLQSQALEWQVVRDGIKRLERIFKFRNFAESLAFTNQVAKIAEEQGHHPVLVTEWGMGDCYFWWTHKIKGLHSKRLHNGCKHDQMYAETNRSD